MDSDLCPHGLSTYCNELHGYSKLSCIAGVVWSLVWLYYVTDSPTENRRIDPNERAYIEASLADIIVKDPSKKANHLLNTSNDL
uniref:Uncharacterized protein n=1 Tax=Parascaris equorum TaxID=6256 RepID=A0A914RMI9_PAREQ